MDCQSNCPSTAECVIQWGDSFCECKSGHVGSLCVPVCNVSPCENGATCIDTFSKSKGYKCKCNSTEYSGN